jgi:methyltransferase (TIGR00027 family)
MAETCSHQDETRREVSATAYVVAFARSMELIQYPDNPWFNHPYAAALAGEFGRQFLQKMGIEIKNFSGSKSDAGQNNMLISTSTRTKVIDDFMLDTFETGIHQVVVFGAGLCTRPWRLEPRSSTASSEIIRYFEIDFQEVFNYKLGVLAKQNAVVKPGFEYHSVTADLSLPAIWPMQLQEAGYDPSKPTLIVMEGFFNYLTETELEVLFTVIQNHFTAESKLIMTCLTSRGKRVTSMHRFNPMYPMDFVQRFGWDGVEQDVAQLAADLGRPQIPEEDEEDSTKDGEKTQIKGTWLSGYVICKLTKVA